MKDLSKNNRYIKLAEDMYDYSILGKDKTDKSAITTRTLGVYSGTFEYKYPQAPDDFISSIHHYFRENGKENTSDSFTFAAYNAEFPERIYNSYYDLTNYILAVNSEYVTYEPKSTFRKIKYRKNLKPVVIKVFIDYNKDNKSILREKYDKLQDEILDKNSSLSFEQLWEYCQFVRWAEKTLFYKNNNKNNRLFVDSKMDDEEKRIFSISPDDNKTRIIFELSKIEDVFSENNSIDNISIVVERDYGKHVSNRYDIVDSDIEYDNDSDLYLINTINIFLKRIVSENFSDILNIIRDYE